jgi:hypothetical protein
MAAGQAAMIQLNLDLSATSQSSGCMMLTALLNQSCILLLLKKNVHFAFVSGASIAWSPVKTVMHPGIIKISCCCWHGIPTFHSLQTY